MRVLAVDPGGTTGWMLWGGDPGHLDDWGECSPTDFFQLLNCIACGWLDAIVCERYTVTANTLKKSRQTDALELIGVLKYEAWQRDIPFVLQQQNPRFCTDNRLRLCGLYVPGDHGRSAARQLLLYLVDNDISPGATPEELLAAG